MAVASYEYHDDVVDDYHIVRTVPQPFRVVEQGRIVRVVVTPYRWSRQVNFEVRLRGNVHAPGVRVRVYRNGRLRRSKTFRTEAWGVGQPFTFWFNWVKGGVKRGKPCRVQIAMLGRDGDVLATWSRVVRAP
jgi:hypothetical protein